jgi:hypothetical protein
MLKTGTIQVLIELLIDGMGIEATDKMEIIVHNYGMEKK